MYLTRRNRGCSTLTHSTHVWKSTGRRSIARHVWSRFHWHSLLILRAPQPLRVPLTFAICARTFRNAVRESPRHLCRALAICIISIGLITCVSCAYWITLGCAGNTATLRHFSECFSWFASPRGRYSPQIGGGHAEAVHHSFIGAPLLEWPSRQGRSGERGVATSSRCAPFSFDPSFPIAKTDGSSWRAGQKSASRRRIASRGSSQLDDHGFSQGGICYGIHDR